MSTITHNTRAPHMGTGHPDNFQTPGSALDCLLPHLYGLHTPYLHDPHLSICGMHVWEPAAGKGNLVKRLLQAGHVVTSSDILHGCDFLTADIPPGVEVIVTNPPYSIKNQWIERCYELGLPFALLLPLSALESKRRQAQWAKGLEIVFPAGRIHFETPHDRGSSSWFYTAWFTHGLQIGRPFTFPEEQ